MDDGLVKESTRQTPFSKIASVPEGQAMYEWQDAPAYKNEILRSYQRILIRRGITDKEHLKLLVAQLVQENGALDPLHTTGDHGCAVGIMQWNACIHAKVSAKRYMELHPEWKSADFQLEKMAEMVAARYEKYNGDIKRIIVSHNRPASAAAGVDTKAGYFKSVQSRTSLLVSL